MAMIPFDKGQQNALTDQLHWGSSEIMHSIRPVQVYKLWLYSEKTWAKSVKWHESIAFSVIHNDTKLLVKSVLSP